MWDPVVVIERVQRRAVTAQKLIVSHVKVVENEPDAAFVATEKSSGGSTEGCPAFVPAE